MHTENGLQVDLTEIGQIVQQADVFTIGFRLFAERVVIDTRHDEREIPMVAIVDPVESMQERFFWLGQHRPSLGVPKQFMFFFWPHSVAYLEESGVWRQVRERLVSSHFEGAAETCDAALRDLKTREHVATVEAIRGPRYQTLWSARD
jgi:hypothetical protein